MQRLVVVMFLGAAVVGCSDDDGGAKTTPDTALVETPAALSNQGRVRILFEARGNANGFFCTLDANAPVACISPFEADVADGEHTFAVAAALNQNVDETPATHTWRVDTASPETAILLGPPALDNALMPELTFSSPEADATFECALDGAAFAACTSPHVVTVADGMHTFAVRAKDPAGNLDGSPATHAWTVDATAPDTLITAGPAAGATTAASGTFTFESPDADATFECAFDGGAFTACTSPRAFTLANGDHTFAVRAKDAAGLVDPSPATRAWTVDTVAPTVSITSAPMNPSSDATPAFAFSSPDATATFECQIDGVVTFTACTSPFTAPALADGARAFRVRATDPVGNVGTAATHAWVVDTVAPTVALTTQPAALSADSTPSVAFTTAGAPVAVECAVDAGAFAACTSPFTSAALADGTHTITVRARDAAGNTGTATTSPFAIDTVAPMVAITTQPAALSNDATPTVSFTTAGNPTVTQCRVDAGAFVACTSPFTSAALADGPHTITIRVADGAGNASTATTASFTVDTVAPTVTITAQPAAVSNDTTPSVSFTTAGNPTATACQVDAGAFAACTSPFTSAALADGSHTITVRVTDGAGNTASAATSAFTIDTVAPTVTITAQPGALTNDTTPSVSFTTAGNPTSTQCQVDAGAFAACTSPFTSAALANGPHTITIRVTDAATNSSSATTNTFTIDTVAPTVTITAQPATLSNDNTPAVSFTTAGGPATTECRVDSGTFVACTSPHTFGVTADGSHTITVRAIDGAGNIGSASTSAFTIDTTPPVVAFTEQAPASWPVNYFDFRFTVSGQTSISCSLDGGAFGACTSPHTVTVAYGAAHNLRVQARDGAGNTTTVQSATWTPVRGMVLHYPWEQGSTENTSLLRQRPSHSPDGSVAAVTPFVGGWAGSALGGGTTSHNYATERPLASAPDGAYTVSFWVRPRLNGGGTLWSTLGQTAGIRVNIRSSSLTVLAMENGQSSSATVSVSLDRWVHIALRTTGPGTGLQIFVDGAAAGAVQGFSGFGSGQAPLALGAWTLFDLDDLRFFNHAVAAAEVCATLARGFMSPAGACVPLSPGFEIDFEGEIRDTGAWDLVIDGVQGFSFAAGTLGQLFTLGVTFDWGYVASTASFSANVGNMPPSRGRSFTFSFVPGAAFGRLIDFTRQCAVGGPPDLCGISVSYPDNGVLQLFVGALGTQRTVNITSTGGLRAGRFNNVVVTEQRDAQGVTQAITVFVNNVKTTIPWGASDIYKVVTNDVRLVRTPGLQVDEYEFWPADLAQSLEMLCENGADGEFDVATNTCLLTAGP